MNQSTIISFIAIIIGIIGAGYFYTEGITPLGYSQLLALPILGSLGIEGVRILLMVLLGALLFGFVYLSQERPMVGMLTALATIFSPAIVFGLSALTAPVSMAGMILMGIGVLIATRKEAPHSYLGIVLCIISLSTIAFVGTNGAFGLEGIAVVAGLACMGLADYQKQRMERTILPLLGIFGLMAGIPHAAGLLIVTAFDGARFLFDNPRAPLLFPLGVFGIVFSLLFATEGFVALVYGIGGALILYFFIQLASRDSEVVVRMGYFFLATMCVALLAVTPFPKIINASMIGAMITSADAGPVAVFGNADAYMFHTLQQPLVLTSLEDPQLRKVASLLVTGDDLERLYPQSVFHFVQAASNGVLTEVAYENDAFLLIIYVSQDGTISNDGKLYSKTSPGVGRNVPLTKIRNMNSKLSFTDSNAVVIITENIDQEAQNYLIRAPRRYEEKDVLVIGVR